MCILAWHSLRLLLLRHIWVLHILTGALRLLGIVHRILVAVLRVHDLSRGKHLNGTFILAYRDLLLAFGAVPVGVLEPVEQAGETGQAHADEAEDDTDDAKGVSAIYLDDISEMQTYICILPPSFRTVVLVRLWQNGQSIHWGVSPSWFKGVTVVGAWPGVRPAGG